MTNVYWASWDDYYNRLLSIDYHVNNSGPGTAFSAKVTSATATNGVYATTQMPISLGDISQGSYAPATIKYYIPTGVTGFNTTVYSTCNDTNGASWYYPAKRTTYSYNQANELTSDYDYTGLTTSASYNSGGALTQKTDGTSTTSYSYNGLDKLTGVTTPSTSVSYSYDALGRRISRTEGANTSNYHHDAKTDLIDYETNASGNLSESYNRGADGLISQTDYTGQSPVTSYDLYSPHGDTSAIADQYGNLTGTYRYDAFGNAITANSLTDAYTGKWQRETDPSTGTIRMGVREYDPSLGRFISPDPLKGDPTDPQQRNRYEYVGNNPLSRYDLNGMSWGGDAWGWVQEKAESIRDYLHQPQFSLFTGYIPPQKRLFADSKVINLFNDPMISTGILIGLGIPGGEFEELGVEGEMRGICNLEDASAIAFKAANNVDQFEIPLKHLPEAGGSYSKFAEGIDAKEVIRDALSSPDARFFPNKDGSIKVITNLNRAVGSNEETSVRVIVGGDGQIWTAFPQN